MVDNNNVILVDNTALLVDNTVQDPDYDDDNENLMDAPDNATMAIDEDGMKPVVITNMPMVASRPRVTVTFEATQFVHVDDICITNRKLERMTIGQFHTKNITHFLEARRTFSTHIETNYKISTSKEARKQFHQFGSAPDFRYGRS